MWRTNVKRREWTGRILTTDTIITLMNALVVSRIDYCNVYLRQLQRVLNAAARSGSMTASQPQCGTLRTGYRSGNVWSLSCRCWCLTVCITWHPAICLPCASRSLITLVVVTYARLHVVILLFQPQGRSDTVLAALPWQDRPPEILFQHRYAAAVLHPHSVVIWKLNC